MAAIMEQVREEEWVEVGMVEDIPVLGSRVVRTPRGDIAVFRTRGGEIFALEDRCPHQGGPLSQGIVHGCAVTCPLHNWCIDLRSGEAQAPDEGRTPTREVRITQGRIHLRLSRG